MMPDPAATIRHMSISADEAAYLEQLYQFAARHPTQSFALILWGEELMKTLWAPDASAALRAVSDGKWELGYSIVQEALADPVHELGCPGGPCTDACNAYWQDVVCETLEVFWSFLIALADSRDSGR